MLPHILLWEMSNSTNVCSMKLASEKSKAKLFRDMSIVSLVFDALKNINADPEKLLREIRIRAKFMSPREAGISPESLLWDRTSVGTVPWKWPKDSGMEPVSWLRLRSIPIISGKVEKEAGMVPESLLKERSRNQSFLRFERNAGTEPEMLFQLRSRLTRLVNFPMTGGISPTRNGFFLNRSVRRYFKSAITEGMVPLSRTLDSKPITRLVVSLHWTPYQSQQSKSGCHESNIWSGLAKLFLNLRRAVLSLGWHRSAPERNPGKRKKMKKRSSLIAVKQRS